MEIEYSQNDLEGVCAQNDHIKDLIAAQTGQPNTTKDAEEGSVPTVSCHMRPALSATSLLGTEELGRGLCHTAGELTSLTGGEQLENL